MATNATDLSDESQVTTVAELLVGNVPDTGLLAPIVKKVSAAIAVLREAPPIGKASSSKDLTTPYALLDWWYGSQGGDFMDDRESYHAATTLAPWSADPEQEATNTAFITEELMELVVMAEENKLEEWKGSAESALARALLQLELPLHAFDGTTRMYASHTKATFRDLKRYVLNQRGQPFRLLGLPLQLLTIRLLMYSEVMDDHYMVLAR